MAFYKESCIHCGGLIDRNLKFCPKCGSNSPFNYQCPTCLKIVNKTDKLCSCCGRSLYVNCPHCKQLTFIQENCEKCGKSLMKTCQNKRCNEKQFFENTKCTACGKKM